MRYIVIVAALLMTGCSLHPEVAPPTTVISPQIFQKHVNKLGWIVTPIPPIQGNNVLVYRLAAGANHKIWAAAFGGVSQGELVEILMNGRLKTFPLSIQPIGIASGIDQNLWVTTYAGVVARVTPEGQETDFTVAPSNINLVDIISGPDGALWFDGCSHDQKSGGIGRIDTSGNSTFYPSGCRTVVASGPDGNIWSGDLGINIYSITPQGKLVGTYFVGDELRFNGLAAGSDGAMYAVSIVPNNESDLVRVTTAGLVSHFGTDSNSDPLWALTSGPDGELWISAERSAISLLVTFDVATQSFSRRIQGPKGAGFGLAVGPDGNIWAADPDTSSIDIYVVQAMTVTPKKLTVSVGKSADVSVSEANYQGQWTAVSAKPSIAVVTPNSDNGTFKVTGVGPGTTVVAVYDSMYNSIEIKVTVQ